MLILKNSHAVVKQKTRNVSKWQFTSLQLTAPESFLFYKEKVYVKKVQPQFDVPVGSWDGAEISELCGIYLLYKLTRNDGIGPNGPFKTMD